MKKIKGSLSAIRMSHLVVLFAVMAVSGLAIRTYQLLVMVNPTNGFFENANFTVPVLYGILAVGCVLFLALSFLSKNVPAPKLIEGRNIPLGLASFLAAIGFVWDIIVVARDVLPDMGIGMNSAVYDGLLSNYVKANGGVFVVLQFVFAVLSVFYFIVFGMSHFEGKATYKKISLLSIAPGCWAMFVLVSKLMKAVSFITVSELLFEIGMLVFTMLFFLTFARIVSGVFTVNSMWCTYGCGFPAAIFAGLISVPRGIILAVGRETVEGNDFSFTHLFLFVFITVYIISTLGVGFKNSLKKMQSVSNIVLPDDDEVVVKSSETVTPVLEVQETEETEKIEKKKRFSIADEFKNIGDMGNFFDDEPEEVPEDKEPDNDSEEIQDELISEDVEEIQVIEEVEKTENIKEIEKSSSFDIKLPVEDISFYQIEDLITGKDDENTVAEAVEDYEEKVDEEIIENCDEVDSQIDDTLIAQENPQEIDGDSLEEIQEISFETDGENTVEESTEEISEEIIETEEDGLDFDLADIFAKSTVVEDVYEKPEEIIEEIISEETIDENSKSEVVEETEIFEDIVEAEEIIENVEIPEESEPVITESIESSVESRGGFLEFSQMLIDDLDEEDLVDDTKESEKTVEKAVEIQEPEKEEKPKKEKPQKEKIKKEKVKKEKPQKAPKTFGKKKKKIEDDEPLKIVSLADLRNKKDSD